MDLLTLTVLAEHEPDAVLVDADGDVWHAACALEYIDGRRDYFVRLLAAWRLAPVGSGVCYAGTDLGGHNCIRGGRCKSTTS